MSKNRSGIVERRRDRGQSISINYTLSLIIVTVMMAGLFISMSTYLDDERERVTRSELSVLGNRITADIATADRLARTSDGGRVEVRTSIPPAVAGVDYVVDISSTQYRSTNYWNVTVTLKSSTVSVEKTVKVRTAHEVADSSLNGGPYIVRYRGNADEIEVEDE